MRPSVLTPLQMFASCFGVTTTALVSSPVTIPHAGRSDLAKAFHVLGYTAGAEIGVESARYSRELLEASAGLRLLCVDAWRPYRGYRDHVGTEKLGRIFADALQRLDPHAERVTIRRQFSVDAARDVADGSLDFVYLDANHTHAHVMADLEAWVPKVRSGGIVAGHDYGRSSVGQVQEAVTQWTAAHQIAPWFVLTADRSPSFAWVVA